MIIRFYDTSKSYVQRAVGFISLERPNSINIAVNAIQNLCADNNGLAATKIIKRWKGRVERATTTALETRSGMHQ